MEDAIAWIRKYLIEDSTDWKDILLISMGAILIKLISNPIQAVNQEEEETQIVVPRIKVGMKIRNLDLIKIKKKKVETSVSGVWTQ